jgi:hypothetical protein
MRGDGPLYPTDRGYESPILYVPEASVNHAVPGTRLNVRYFASRCYNEGLSKALVVSSVGSSSGLASGRAYTMHTLPMGAIRGLSGSSR